MTATNLPSLTTGADGVARVSSVDVAERFGKRHADVLRKIVQIIDDAPSTERNFALSEYRDESGKANSCYLMDRRAFSILASKFTGKLALQWTIQFVDAFDAMERRLQEVSNAPVAQLTEREAIRAALAGWDAADARAIAFKAEAETATAKAVEVSKKHEALKSILRDVKHDDGTTTERVCSVRAAVSAIGVMENFLWKLLRDMDCDIGGGVRPLGWLKYENYRDTKSMNEPYAFAKSNNERVSGSYMVRLMVECTRQPHNDGSARFEWQTFFTLDGLIRIKEICDSIPEGVKNRAAVEQRQKNERRRIKTQK